MGVISLVSTHPAADLWTFPPGLTATLRHCDCNIEALGQAGNVMELEGEVFLITDPVCFSSK